MVDKLRECSLRSRLVIGTDSPSCLLCRACFFESGVDKVRLLCYNDGSDELSKNNVPTEIVGDYKAGVCRGFSYRTTKIDEEALEAYVGKV